MLDKMIAKYSLLSDQVDKKELKIILSQLQKVLENDVEGDVVEMGCYVGTTSVYLQRVIAKNNSSKLLYVYDSFAGLPEKNEKDISPAGESFKTGELKTSKQILVTNFKRAGLDLPKIYKAWFNDLTVEDLPDKISFAFLDGDFYESIKQSLTLIENKLNSKSIIVVDDYLSESLPGTRIAVDEWMGKHSNYNLRSEASLAIITCK